MSDSNWKSPNTILGIVAAVVSIIGLIFTIQQGYFQSAPERCARKKASLEKEQLKAKEKWDAKWAEMENIMTSKARLQQDFFEKQKAGTATESDAKNYAEQDQELDRELDDKRGEYKELEREKDDITDEIASLDC